MDLVMPDEFDLFISYAKEDEPRAKDLAASLAPLRVFFAPQRLPATEPNAQALLIAALKRSRTILLLWSRWVDKSEWVALETSVFATDRAALKETHQTHLPVMDLDGPLLPSWLPYDLIVQPAPLKDLTKFFQTPNWWLKAADQRPHRPFSLATEILFRLPAWNTRVRAVLLRVGPKFSISHLRAADLRSVAVARLIRNALAESILWILAIAAVSWALWAWVLHFPHDWQGYVPRGILMSTGAAFAAALDPQPPYRCGCGSGAGVSGSICGCAISILVAFYCRPDPWAGAVAVGDALGAAAATSFRTHQLSDPEEAYCSGFDWRPLVVVLFSVGLVALGQGAAQSWAESNSSPPALQRALFAACLGAFIAAPIAAITAWFAHLQIRLRHRLRPVGIGIFVWIFVIAAIATVAASVPFGNSFDLRDGLGVGLLAGLVGAGLLTIVAPSLQRMAGEMASAPWGVAVLLCIGFPVLKLFPNVRAGTVYAALCLTAPLIFFLIRTSQKTSTARLI